MRPLCQPFNFLCDGKLPFFVRSLYSDNYIFVCGLEIVVLSCVMIPYKFKGASDITEQYPGQILSSDVISSISLKLHIDKVIKHDR